MKKSNKLANYFDETLKSNDLHNVSSGLTEALTDSLLSDGVLKDIPIINTLIGIGKTSIKISDVIFLKKVISFLTELEKVNISDRREMIQKIDLSENYSIRVGEKLLYIIDKCDDHENAKFVSKFFAGYLEDEIDYNCFLRGAKIIERIFISDLITFIHEERIDLEGQELIEYDGTGLYERYVDEISIRDQDDWKALTKYIVEGGQQRGHITEIGTKIRSVLKKRI